MAHQPQREAPPKMPQRSSSGALIPPKGFMLHEEEDKYALPEDCWAYMKDHGVTYQWKRLTYMGKHDAQHQALLAQNRWIPVPLERHPELGTDGALDDRKQTGRFGGRNSQEIPYADCIIRDGQILMERPIEIENYVRAVDKDHADAQVQNQLQRVKMAPEGTLAGVSRQRVGGIVSRTRDLGIPEDAE